MYTIIILFFVIYFTMLFLQRKHPDRELFSEFKTLTSVLATSVIVGIISAIDFGINHEEYYNYNEYHKYEIISFNGKRVNLVTEKGDTINRKTKELFSDNIEYVITDNTVNYAERYSLAMDTTLSSKWILRIGQDRNVRSVFHLDSTTYSKIINKENE